MYARVIDLKAKNPSLKVMLAIGGWNAGANDLSNMVTDWALRQKFVSTTATFLTKYKFDGLDLE
jgi:chitinase